MQLALSKNNKTCLAVPMVILSYRIYLIYTENHKYKVLHEREMCRNIILPAEHTAMRHYTLKCWEPNCPFNSKTHWVSNTWNTEKSIYTVFEWIVWCVCDLLPYGLVGPPAHWQGVLKAPAAILHPSSSSPSSVCDAKVFPPNTAMPRLSVLSHCLWSRAHSELQGEKDRASEIRG